MLVKPVMRKRGFTLVELIITVAVIAIVATIAIPNFQSVLNSSKLRGDVNEVLAALNYARAEAIKCRGDVELSISGDPWGLTVTSEDLCTMMRPLDGVGNFGVEGDVEIVFDRLGRAPGCTSGGCAIVIDSRTITVSPSGYIEF
ncbi:GspH/FimT family pseudopilin [Halomonas tibetensis]|uniref:Type II secretion system protein H n=1 Tax=Halomonas tibetensis TaxID=2259590 RepID=A0ABV7B982_9GAMM